jgi:hypothetical protein
MEADGFRAPARTRCRPESAAGAAAYRKHAICLPRPRLKWFDRLPQAFALGCGCCLADALRFESRAHIFAPGCTRLAENVI